MGLERPRDREPAGLHLALISDWRGHDPAHREPEFKFSPRLLEGVELPAAVEPELLLLDGQGKPVNRSPSGADHPFASTGHLDDSTQVMLAEGESATVRFKSTGRKNLRTGEKDPRMEWAVVKSLAGFMNATGGTLLVGVADDGSVVGVEDDYPVVGKASWDGCNLWLTSLLTSTLGKAAAAEVALSAHDLDGRTVARLDVGPAAAPVFAQHAGV